MLAQPQHRFSVQDYYRMAETGVFQPDARVELIDGQIIDMSPIGPPHGGTVKHLNNLFTQAARGRWLVSAQDPLHLDNQSEPQPDLMLLKPSPDFYRSRHPAPDDVLLLIEVADTSLDFDRGTKLSAYGRAGIKEVWIVNLIDKVVEVNRDPHFLGYGRKQIVRPGDTASPLAFPDVSVDVADLLR